MNRRGAALIVALLTLMLAGALASAALVSAHLRWRAGLARTAAAEATIRVHSSLARSMANWNSHFDSMPIGSAEGSGRAEGDEVRQWDSVLRLGASLFQLKSIVEVGPAGIPPLGRAGAAMLLRIELQDSATPCPPADDSAAALQVGPQPVDGIRSGRMQSRRSYGLSEDSHCAGGTLVEGAVAGRRRRVPGGWWRVD